MCVYGKLLFSITKVSFAIAGLMITLTQRNPKLHALSNSITTLI